MLANLEARIRLERDSARGKAWDALARGKLWMFGYWAAKERQFSGMLGESKPSPWAELRRIARANMPAPPDSQSNTDAEETRGKP